MTPITFIHWEHFKRDECNSEYFLIAGILLALCKQSDTLETCFLFTSWLLWQRSFKATLLFLLYSLYDTWWQLIACELSIGDMKSLHDNYEHLGLCYYPHHRHNCNHVPKNTSYGAILYDIYILTAHAIIYEQCYLCPKRLAMTEGQELSGVEVWRISQYIYFLSVN